VLEKPSVVMMVQMYNGRGVSYLLKRFNNLWKKSKQCFFSVK